jgi:hypothetical protein
MSLLNQLVSWALVVWEYGGKQVLTILLIMWVANLIRNAIKEVVKEAVDEAMDERNL